jgi:hypothetical protein
MRRPKDVHGGRLVTRRSLWTKVIRGEPEASVSCDIVARPGGQERLREIADWCMRAAAWLDQWDQDPPRGEAAQPRRGAQRAVAM